MSGISTLSDRTVETGTPVVLSLEDTSLSTERLWLFSASSTTTLELSRLTSPGGLGLITNVNYTAS